MSGIMVTDSYYIIIKIIGGNEFSVICEMFLILIAEKKCLVPNKCERIFEFLQWTRKTGYCWCFLWSIWSNMA